LRAGTENVASVVALGAAAEIAVEELPEESDRLSSLRDRLYELLAERIPQLALNGHPTLRLPNTLNVSVPGIGMAVLACAPGVAASTGSACHAASPEPSAVLTAMGLSRELALGALRLSLGRWSTDQEVERAADLLAEGCRQASINSLVG
jgi:cysteine desulfurase